MGRVRGPEDVDDRSANLRSQSRRRAEALGIAYDPKRCIELLPRDQGWKQCGRRPRRGDVSCLAHTRQSNTRTEEVWERSAKDRDREAARLKAADRKEQARQKRVEAKVAKLDDIQIRARAEMAAYSRKLDVNPVQAMLDLIGWTAGHVEFLRGKVQEVTESAGDDALIWGMTKYSNKTGGEDWGTTEEEGAAVHVWLKLYNDERDRLSKYCEKAIRLGIEERRVRIAERQGEAVHRLLVAIFADLNLSPEQAALAPLVSQRHLLELSSGFGEPQGGA